MSPSDAPRRPARGLIYGSIVLALCLALAYAVTLSPLLEARTIKVEGLDHLKEQKVLQLAQVGEGTNILWLSGSAVTDRLVKDPWIASAEVSRAFPSTLTIAITERRPAAVMAVAGGYVLVASDGMGLENLTRQSRLPVIVGGSGPGPGEKVPSRWLPAAAAAGFLEAASLAAVAKIVVRDDGTIEMDLRAGGRVEYGPPTELEAKAQALAGILSWANENHSKIRSVDLTAPSAPAAKVQRPSSA